jgi:hypothetical protein
MTSSPYLSLVQAFTAEVSLTIDGNTTAFRIAAPSRVLVEEELARLLRQVTERRATWQAIGPIWWEPNFVVFGEVHEAKGEKG